MNAQTTKLADANADNDYRWLIYKTYGKCPRLGLRRCASLTRRLIIAHVDAKITGERVRMHRILKVLFDSSVAHEKIASEEWRIALLGPRESASDPS